jgi:hypothetical protein
VAVNLAHAECALPGALAAGQMLYAQGVAGATLAPFGCAIARA